MKMASITDARLAITIDAGTKMAKCIVTAKVNFSAYEMAEMKEGLRFRLDCQLWEDDPVWDDFIYTYASKYFPDSSPAATEPVSFEVSLKKDRLNQDIGTDEVFGKLKLVNLYTNVKVTKNTNTISYKF